MLHGPSHAGNYRVQVGRYRDRFYVDPLPCCAIAPAAPDWQAPSVSWTKPPFANKYVPMRAIADMPSPEWARLANTHPDYRYEAIKSHDKLAGRVNMDRGSIVHQWAEDRLLGRTALFAEPSRWADGALEAAEKFRPALDAFFDAYQPEPYAVEAVCLHRTLNDVGYGGTMDALVKIDGAIWAVDWKSRHSDHAAYLEEAAQGGAYIGAQYMIVAGDDGEACRVAVPEVAGVLIVSIREDGYRAFPIDADKAVAAYADMHRWAVAHKMTHASIVGKPWGPRATAAPTVDRRQQLRDRYAAFDDQTKLEFRALDVDPDDLDAVEAALNQVDPFNIVIPPDIPEPRPILTPAQAPELPTNPDEGDDVNDTTFAALERRTSQLSTEQQQWIGSISGEAKVARVPFHANRSTGRRTVRRFELIRGLVVLAERDHCDDELVRELVATVVDGDWPFFANVTTGHVLGALDATEAATFSRLCDALCADVTAVDLRTRNTAA